MREDLAKPAGQSPGRRNWEVLAERYRHVLCKANHSQRDSALNQMKFYLQALSTVRRTRTRNAADRRASLAALQQLFDELKG